MESISFVKRLMFEELNLLYVLLQVSVVSLQTHASQNSSFSAGRFQRIYFVLVNFAIENCD